MTRSRRGTAFRGIHAAHPAITPTSAQFFTPEKPKTAEY
ncbi:hypothetical protein KKH3_29190 [Pectobacterium actinidiae]|nr:hypothetical protein KKH3_29190 [Pectobacterium actinidiae]